MLICMGFFVGAPPRVRTTDLWLYIILIFVYIANLLLITYIADYVRVNVIVMSMIWALVVTPNAAPASHLQIYAP